MHFSTSFVAVALALSVTAIPSQKRGKSFSIPLTKRIADVTPDGTADIDNLKSHISSSTNKIYRSMDLYERNTGSPHPLTPSHAIRARNTGSEHLSKVNTGNMWVGEAYIGTPPQKIRVDFETGMSEFWTMGKGCGESCDGHDQYDPGSSITAKDLKQPFEWASADGATVGGQLYSDVFNVAGLFAIDQVVGSGTEISDGYWLPLFPLDSLVGLGFEETSQFKAKPLFQTLIEQGQVDEPVFAFKIDDEDGSELKLGGVNHELYKGDIYWSTITTKGLWEITMESLSLNGEQFLNSKAVIVDSGIRLLMADTSVVEDFMGKIPGSKDGSETIQPGFWSIPCDSIPDVAFTFAGHTFEVPKEKFNMGQVAGSEEDCVAGLAGAPIGDMFIVGEVFLRSAYSVFDVGHTRIGFAEYA